MTRSEKYHAVTFLIVDANIFHNFSLIKYLLVVLFSIC